MMNGLQTIQDRAVKVEAARWAQRGQRLWRRATGHAGLAYNLAVAARRWGFEGAGRRMQLWRLRSEVLALAGYAVHHGRVVVMRLIDARDHLAEQLVAAIGRLARL